MSAQPQQQREPARRVFAQEFNESNFQFKESNEDRAPKYQLLASGHRANRIFFVGSIIDDPEEIGGDADVVRARIIDPTGEFYVYSSQYSPEASATLRSLEPPEYVAVVGKPNMFTDDEGVTRVNVRPERIVPVDQATRDRWVAETAEETMERLAELREKGVSDDPNYDVYQHYGDEVVNSVAESVVEALENLAEE